jgi:DNA-binding MarR family transcriptional regulator
MAEMDWDLYGWVARGKQRRTVIRAMDKPKIPSEIRRETKLSITHVSKILRLFREKRIAKCLNPNSMTGKVYELTEIGKRIRSEMVKEVGK